MNNRTKKIKYKRANPRYVHSGPSTRSSLPSISQPHGRMGPKLPRLKLQPHYLFKSANTITLRTATAPGRMNRHRCQNNRRRDITLGEHLYHPEVLLSVRRGWPFTIQKPPESMSASDKPSCSTAVSPKHINTACNSTSNTIPGPT